MADLVRRDVYGLQGPWHPILRAYAFAVGKMRALPSSDVRSLAYQASVHGVFADPNRDIPPPNAFQAQCQHNCWYFIPWHRWYLYYFEEVVRSFLPDMEDCDDELASTWTLPYWDYSRPGAAALPPEFASEFLEDGTTPNPLYDGTRQPGVNERTATVDPRQAVPGVGVLQQPYSSSTPGPATFGGTASAWHHFREPGAVAGGLEATPHNAVHGFVGGDMGAFNTAGLDPIFWLHHCNIDRYWEVYGHHRDPTTWDSVKFSFRAADGSQVSVTSSACRQTTQLGYVYESITPPPPPIAGDATESTWRSEMVDPATEPPDDVPAEVVGTSDPVELTGAPVEAVVAVGPVSDDFRTTREGREEPQRVYLTVEDITGDTNPGISYAVYVGDPADDRLAGLVSFFGIEGTQRGGVGLGYSFDITDIVQRLRDEDAWDPAAVRTTFVPIGPPVEANRTEHPSLEVGSVNILFR